MRGRNFLSVVAALLCSVSIARADAPAPASPSQPELDATVQDLKARLAALEGKPSSNVVWTFNDLRPTVKTSDGKYELSLRGVAQMDWAAYDQESSDFGDGYGAVGTCALTNSLCDLGSGAVFRRMRLGVEGRLMGDLLVELRIEFGGSDTEAGASIHTARLAYVGIPGLRIQAGAFEPILMLQTSTSANELLSVERPSVNALVSSVFGGDDGRRGVEITYQKEHLLYDGDNLLISTAITGNRTSGQGGCAASGHSGGNSVDDECAQMFGRFAYRLWSDKVSNIQVGATGGEILSLQGRDANGDRLVQFRDRPEVRVSGERFIDTGGIPAEGGSFYGIEAGMNWDNVYLASEWYEWTVERDISTVGGNDPTFSGWYVEGEWIFTGEAKRFSASSTGNNYAVWRGPAVSSPFPSGGLGAWSVSGRYSLASLNWNEGSAGAACVEFAACIRGGEQSIVNVGLNWYMNANVRVMAEYAMVDVDRLNYAGASLDAEFDILQGRLQFSF